MSVKIFIEDYDTVHRSYDNSPSITALVREIIMRYNDTDPKRDDQNVTLKLVVHSFITTLNMTYSRHTFSSIIEFQGKIDIYSVVKKRIVWNSTVMFICCHLYIHCVFKQY